MQQRDAVIITCAVTGSVHTPSMSPALPLTPQEIADQSVAAADAGAAIIHLHARDPIDGRPTPDPIIFRDILDRMAGRSDAIINITTGGSNRMTLAERMAAPLALAPELCSFNMGTMNFVFSGAARRVAAWQYPWEESHVMGSEEVFPVNTLATMKRIAHELGEEQGTRFEFECYDVGHLYMLAHLADEGHVKPPFFIQCIFGVLGGIGADICHLTHMIQTADRLFGDTWLLSVLAAGRHQIPFATASAIAGGHVRVGLEDSLFIGKGELATCNAQQVERARRAIENLGLEVADAGTARSMLQLKGASHVRF